MAPPRSPKEALVAPGTVTVGGGDVAATDKLNDIYQRLGAMQSSITYLEGQAQDASKDLRTISSEITTAKATFRTLKVVFGIVGTVCVALWTLITAVVVMMANIISVGDPTRAACRARHRNSQHDPAAQRQVRPSSTLLVTMGAKLC